MSTNPSSTGNTLVDSNIKLMFPLVLIVLFGFFSIGIPLASFPGHIHGTLGFSTLWVGIVLGLQSIVTLLTRHYSGTMSDMKGAKTAVFRGVSLTVVSGIVSMLSHSFNQDTGLLFLLMGRVILGVGESLLITGALAWGVGLLGPAKAGRVMAWSGMAMYGAIALSAPLSIYLNKNFGFSSVLGATVALPIFAGLISFFVPATPALGKERMPFYKVVNRVWKSGVGLSFSAVGFAGLAGFAALYFQERGWGNASLVMMIFGVAFISARIFFGHAPDKFGGKRIAIAAVLIEVIGQALIWKAPTATLALVGAGLTGFGYSLAFPSFGVEAVKSVEPQFKGVALGAYVAFFDLALGITGPIAGAVASGFGYSAVYLFGFISCCIAAIMAWRL